MAVAKLGTYRKSLSSGEFVKNSDSISVDIGGTDRTKQQMEYKSAG